MEKRRMLNLMHLARIYDEHQDCFNAQAPSFTIGSLTIQPGIQPAIMGVVNLSADSWYRESVVLSVEAAVQRCKILFEQGAHIIDLGAESTLAHASRVDDAAQTSKLLPVIHELKSHPAIISVETYSPAVTEASLKAGAKVLNMTGNVASREIYQAAVEHDAAVIICYVQGPHVRQVGDFNLSGDVIPVMYEYFARELEIATSLGLKKIFIDPGLGFYYRNLQDSSSRVRHQMTTFLNTFRLRKLGFPVCHALPHAFDYFQEEVRSAEPFFAVLAALGQTDLFRTHEVAKTKAVLATLSEFK
ncbi:MAG: dihydropteroate synthase [Verrucomicrobiales bacterium]